MLAGELLFAARQFLNNLDRAKDTGCLIVGDTSPRAYWEIRKSSPCVYCGAAAVTVDHVWPLFWRGPEAVSNLVPACRACNVSKRAYLLTEWNPERVAHGVAHSAKVAAEYERLRSAGP
jgi:hypothetical protein